MKTKALLAIIFAAAFLVACNRSPAQGGASITDVSTVVPQSTGPNTEEIDVVQKLTMLQGFGGVPLGGFGRDGLYFVTPWARSDGSFNLWYADYDTRSILPLCAQPNCSHTNDSCTSYIAMSPGGVLPEVVGDQLVLFYLGQTHGYDEEGQSANPRLEVMELDGSGRRETLSFSPNQMVEKPMLTDGENIYARLTTYQADETKAELIGINPTQGTYKVVCSLDANQNERIWGCAGSYLILYRTQQEGAGLELCRLNLQTTECETIYQWNETQAYPALYGDTLVYQNQTDRSFHLLNVLSMEDVALQQYVLPEQGSDTWVVVHDYDQGKLLFEEVVTNSQTKQLETERFYTLRTDTETLQEWALVYSYLGKTTPVTRVTDIDDEHYLVIVSENEVSVPENGVEGPVYYAAGGNQQYASISKADYWAGNANVSLFEEWGELS